MQYVEYGARKTMIARSGSAPKSTIFVMVCATVALRSVMTNTPRKLNSAAIKIAAFGGMHLVTTQVAMALGASVYPLTRITPSVRDTAISSCGLAVI